MAVLDFGGGTCDVAVLHHAATGSVPLEITAHAGLDDLGGVSIDHVFALWVRTQIRAQGLTDLDDALDERTNLASLHALYDAVTAAKHRLADWEYADVPVSLGETRTSVTVTINEFNQIIAAETDRARALLERSIDAAGITPKDLHGLYLTGGSSRLRWIHQMAAELLEGRPAHLTDPHLVVALGAHSATSMRVRERVDAESSRFITLRGLQATPGLSRSIPLPPPSGRRLDGAPPAAPPPPPRASARVPGPAPLPPPDPGMRHAGPPPPSARRSGPAPSGAIPVLTDPSRSPGTVAEALLAAQPRLEQACNETPELRPLLDRSAVLVALLSVPGLLEQVARHPALMTTPPNDGSPRRFTAPDDPDSAALPARLFFAGQPGWANALEDPAWRRSFANSGGGPIWAYALVQGWSGLSPSERAQAGSDPQWQPPAAPPPPWIERSPGRVVVTVASPATPTAATSGAGFAHPPPVSSWQADVLDVLRARGAFDQGEAFRERLNAARDPRLPSQRGTVTCVMGSGGRDDVDLYVFAGGRHRGGRGVADRELSAYALLLPSRRRRTSWPLLALTRDLVDTVFGGAQQDIGAHRIALGLTQEVGTAAVPSGPRVELIGRDPGLGVDLARTLDRPWRPR